MRVYTAKQGPGVDPTIPQLGGGIPCPFVRGAHRAEHEGPKCGKVGARARRHLASSTHAAAPGRPFRPETGSSNGSILSGPAPPAVPCHPRRTLPWGPISSTDSPRLGLPTQPPRCPHAQRPGRAAPPVRRHAAGLRLGAAAGADRPGHAGLAHGGGHRPGDHRLPEPGRPALHLQIPVGAAARPLRAALARPPARLAGAGAAGAGRRAAGAGGDLAARHHPRLRAAGGGAGLLLGVAGRRHRRLPHRLAAAPPSAAWARR